VRWDSGVSSRLGFKLWIGRFVLTDAQWAKMEALCLGKPGDPGRSGKDNRRFVEAVLWIARTGSPWRDLPPSFGHWNSVFTRFRDWAKADMVVRNSMITRLVILVAEAFASTRPGDRHLRKAFEDTRGDT
jgi:transposase